MTSWSFLARFVAWSAAFFTLWSLVLAEWYVRFLAAIGPYAAALFGFTVDTQGTGRDLRVLFKHGDTPVGLHLETAALGLLPFLALVASTTWQTLLQRLKTGAIGVGIFVLFHLTLFIAYPVFLSRSNIVVDSLGAFWAILGYCGFPFLLWLVLITMLGSRNGGQAAGKRYEGRGKG